ncbi:glutathione S-transferase [Loktanella ponticola]|uniref:Glutathione S-transferase n=1 Tax=Yoonia ponticola TaxID=1524255 RepID=A0A7W9EY27_9RHOB|nr:glutathione S-transferase [Yoonia ponticola]MBB5720491.1 glutathione S-transferase [Yoonia ponticola]
MTHELYIGDRTFSSWSLRGWLLLEKFGLPYKTTMVGLYAGTMAADMAHLVGAKTVPALVTPSGGLLTDSIAIAETLAEENPDAGLYPKNPAARAMARSLVAEMHGSFNALRGDCPHNMDHTLIGFTPSDAVMKDVTRISELWSLARDRFGADGPWLFGNYSAADAFYAPIANRFATYGIALGVTAQAYVDTHIADTANRQWRAMGQTVTYDPFPYDFGLAKAPWPVDIIPAKSAETGPSENKSCPYSGDPVTHYLVMDGRKFGFCNASCRDKTVADPAAWPKFMELVNG